MEINVLEFLTKEHKVKIAKKIDEAIDKINTNKLAKQIENDLSEHNFGDYIFEEIDLSKITSKLEDKIKESIFNK